MLLAQFDPGVACMHSFKRLAMSLAVALMHTFRIFRTHAFFTIFRTHAGLAVHAGKETVRLLHKVLYT